MTLLGRLLIALAAAFVVALCGTAAGQETRTITVRLHIDVPEGITLPADYRPELNTTPPTTPMLYYSASRGAGEGDFVMSGQIPVSATKVWVVLREGFSADSELAAPPEVEERLRFRAFWEFTKQLWTPERLTIELEPGVDEYSRTVTAERAVTVRGIFKDEQGKGLDSFMLRQDHSNFMLTTRSSSLGFAALGVRRSHPTWLAHRLPGNGMECLIRYFAAEELSEDVMLGTIIVPPSGADVRADIALTNNDAIVQGLEFIPGKVSYLTAISEDASRMSILILVNNRTRASLDGPDATELAYLKSGARFLVPGDPGISPHVDKVLRLLRAGRANDLIAAGVPHISPAPGDTVTMTIDALDIVKRIEGIKE